MHALTQFEVLVTLKVGLLELKVFNESLDGLLRAPKDGMDLDMLGES